MATKKKAAPEKAAPEKAAPEKAGQKKAAQEQAVQEQAPAGEEILQKAAKAIGSALGTIAVKTGMAHAEAQPSKKIPKLAKKAKQRLPRKAKKQAKKRLLAAG